jgi:hypothetical protein
MVEGVFPWTALEHGRNWGQPVVKVKVYAEGGGEGELLDALFRQGWNEFYKSAGLQGRMPRTVRGKGRGRTFDLFLTAVKNAGANDLPLLLVDSEGPVTPGHTAWQHLKARDNWDRPNGVSNDQAFMMVQVMETWFIADRQMLGHYFGPNFRSNQIPAWPSLEAVSKNAVFETLDSATANCGKKRYSKGKVSFELLSRLNPDVVEDACPHAKALLDRLRGI